MFHDDLSEFLYISLLFRPVSHAFVFAPLHFFCGHYDNSRVFLPNHPPEIRHGALKTSLRRDVTPMRHRTHYTGGRRWNGGGAAAGRRGVGGWGRRYDKCGGGDVRSGGDAVVLRRSAKVVGSDVIGVDIIAAGDVGVAVSENHPSLVERQNVFVTILVFVFRLRAFFTRNVASIDLLLQT